MKIKHKKVYFRNKKSELNMGWRENPEEAGQIWSIYTSCTDRVSCSFSHAIFSPKQTPTENQSENLFDSLFLVALFSKDFLVYISYTNCPFLQYCSAGLF